MLSSKEILERTGISRATLNNYISAGLIPRPDVLPPDPQDGGAPRIGYFPDDTIERIETIQRLKREGWSLGRILESFSGSPSARAEVAAPVPMPAATGVSAEPQVLVVAVLAVTLHDADSLWVALSVHDYFALANDVAEEVRRIAATHEGQLLRVAPHRFVCRFLPRGRQDHLWAALEASQQVREAVREVNARWKLRRDWPFDVQADAGLCEGESWVSAAAPGDLQMVGESMGDAEEFARCARAGTVLATRTFIARLPQALRERVAYGVPAQPMTFARLADIAPAHALLPQRLAAVPVTEIVELRAAATPAWKEPE
ncbi:MerR family transcriptional regulator [Ramlibacter sp. PS4R-6]|uniref:MerR family transcriptional regulator n=1 Tax=Ramlibacter sp. PS4R-6 TaxID=3133438 RepID=UPI0030AC52FF